MTQLKDKYSIGIGPDGLPGFFDDLEAKVYVREDRWNSDMSQAPIEQEFVCRHISKPWIQFEAIIVWEDDGRESTIGSYKVLYDANNEDNALDDDWCMYEWQPLPKGPAR